MFSTSTNVQTINMIWNNETIENNDGNVYMFALKITVFTF